MSKQDQTQVNEQVQEVNNQDLNPVVDSGAETQPTSIESKTTKLVSLKQVTLDNGEEVWAATLKDGRVSTKSSLQSYEVAVVGPCKAANYAQQQLRELNANIIAGADITYEEKVYPQNAIVRVRGELRLFPNGLTITHITSIDVSPIGLTLFLDYQENELEGNEPSEMMMRLYSKAFGFDF